MSDVVWLPVVGFEGWYEVSNLGAVRRTRVGPGTYPGKELRAQTNQRGYKSVWLHRDGGRYGARVHQLVAAAFIGPPCGLDVNHKDAVKSNNSADNLEYVTKRENARHAARLGLMSRRGIRRAGEILNQELVLRIRSESAYETRKSLAQKYGVSLNTIHAILVGRRWGWVKS